MQDNSLTYLCLNYNLLKESSRVCFSLFFSLAFFFFSVGTNIGTQSLLFICRCGGCYNLIAHLIMGSMFNNLYFHGFKIHLELGLQNLGPF